MYVASSIVYPSSKCNSAEIDRRDEGHVGRTLARARVGTAIHEADVPRGGRGRRGLVWQIVRAEISCCDRTGACLEETRSGWPPERYSKTIVLFKFVSFLLNLIDIGSRLDHDACALVVPLLAGDHQRRVCAGPVSSPQVHAYASPSCGTAYFFREYHERRLVRPGS